MFTNEEDLEIGEISEELREDIGAGIWDDKIEDEELGLWGDENEDEELGMWDDENEDEELEFGEMEEFDELQTGEIVEDNIDRTESSKDGEV